MPRINEHVFKLNGVEYRLTYYTGDKPRIFKDDEELKINISELLRTYLCELGYEHERLIGKTTQQLSNLILNHFSEKKIKQKVKNPIPKKLNLKNEVKSSLLIQEKLELSENFKVVMICSSKKNVSAFDQFPNVKFKSIVNAENVFHPDGLIPNSQKSWREYLIEHQNDKNLKKAYKLYSRKEYISLYDKFKDSLYILSAGWGLVSAEFKLPIYDVTFSSKSGSTNKRDKGIKFNDFNQLEISDNEDIVFIGSGNYLPLFYSLTFNLPNRKLIFFFGKGNNLPQPMVNQNTFKFINFQSLNNRSWYYELANLLCEDINFI
jgi:hypothetical protein